MESNSLSPRLRDLVELAKRALPRAEKLTRFKDPNAYCHHCKGRGWVPRIADEENHYIYSNQPCDKCQTNQ